MKPILSLVIPVYNEANHLADFFTLIDGIDLGVTKELVIIDDASTDHSAEIIKNFPFKSLNQQIFRTNNGGKGSAIRDGFARANGSIVGIQDSDFEYDPYDIPEVIAPIMDDKADAVFGSRFKKSNAQVFRTYHYLINRILTILSNLFSGIYLSDMETCYKFFRSDLITGFNLQSKRFGIEPEITALLAQTTARISEVPIRYIPRTYKNGKKIRWQDGVAAVWHIFYFNCLAGKIFNDSLPAHYKPKSRQWL